MPEQSFARYVSFTAPAIEGLKRTLIERFLAQAVEIVRQEIINVMAEGAPSGRIYPRPEGGTYRASAPGEPPAIRTGDYLKAWDTTEVQEEGSRLVAFAMNTIRVGERDIPGLPELGKASIPLWRILEFGTVNMAPRGHIITGIERAVPKIKALAREFSSTGLTRRPSALDVAQGIA